MASTVTLVAALVAACGPAAGSAADVELLDPWGRPTPPGVDASALYVTIHSTDAEGDRLVAVTSERCGLVAVHLSEMRDGVMSMRPADAGALTIEGGGTLATSAIIEQR